MQILSKIILGLPLISSPIGVFEGCVLGKRHKEMRDKGKYCHTE